MTVQVNWEADVEVSVQQAPAGEEQQREAAVGAGRAGSPAKASLQYWQWAKASHVGRAVAAGSLRIDFEHALK
jgi:hypothetical protein